MKRGQVWRILDLDCNGWWGASTGDECVKDDGGDDGHADEEEIEDALEDRQHTISQPLTDTALGEEDQQDDDDDGTHNVYPPIRCGTITVLPITINAWIKLQMQTSA